MGTHSAAHTPPSQVTAKKGATTPALKAAGATPRVPAAPPAKPNLWTRIKSTLGRIHRPYMVETVLALYYLAIAGGHCHVFCCHVVLSCGAVRCCCHRMCCVTLGGKGSHENVELLHVAKDGVVAMHLAHLQLDPPCSSPLCLVILCCYSGPCIDRLRPGRHPETHPRVW